MSKAKMIYMPGAIAREQGESFASFAARQKAKQESERAEYMAQAKAAARARRRKHDTVPEVSDHDYSMNS